MVRRRALLLAIVAGSALLFASTARAQRNPPSMGNSTIPVFIHLVGSTAGVHDTTAGRFTVVIRDIANNPVSNSFVVVDFSSCPDIRIASDQLNPNYTVNCTYHTVGAYTNVEGKVVFTLLGSSWDAGTYSGLGAVYLYSDGWRLGSPIASVFDLNGSSGVSAADLSFCVGDLGSHSYRARSDFNGDGMLTAGDLSLLLGELGTHRSTVSAAACP
jgi:hypothetical protein